MARSALPAATRGILWMLLAMIMFAGVNTTAKYLTQFHSVPQVLWARYVFHALVLVLLLAPRLKKLLATNRLKLQLFRSFLLLVTTGLFFTGLSRMGVADAMAVMFLTPILITALSVPILGETVGPRRWAGVAVGLAGALIIVRPGMGVAQVAALTLLAAAFTHAFYQIATRRLSGTDVVLTTLLYTASVGAVLSSLVVPWYWVTPDAAGWLLMALMGTFAAAGHFALIQAYTAAEASVVTPFQYSGLLWATLFGFLVFGDLPDGWTVLGAGIVAASGLYLYRREHQAMGGKN